MRSLATCPFVLIASLCSADLGLPAVGGNKINKYTLTMDVLVKLNALEVCTSGVQLLLLFSSLQTQNTEESVEAPVLAAGEADAAASAAATPASAATPATAPEADDGDGDADKASSTGGRLALFQVRGAVARAVARCLISLTGNITRSATQRRVLRSF
jgi:ribosomal protein L12E/L44/L45/RPP1/RPP2